MSTVMNNIPATGVPASKMTAVLHERNIPTLGTNNAGLKHRIAVKRAIAASDTRIVNDIGSTTSMQSVRHVHDAPSVKSRRPGCEIKSEKNILQRKRTINTGGKSKAAYPRNDKVTLRKSDECVLNKNVKINGYKPSDSNLSNDKLTVENINAGDTDDPANNVLYDGNIVDHNIMISNECCLHENIVNTGVRLKHHSSCTSIIQEHSNISSHSATQHICKVEDADMARHQVSQPSTHLPFKTSKTTECNTVSVTPGNTSVKVLQTVSNVSDTNCANNRILKNDKIKENMKSPLPTLNCSRKESGSASSIPRLTSVILNTCDSEQTVLNNSVANKSTYDNLLNADKSEQGSQLCHNISDAARNKSAKTSTGTAAKITTSDIQNAKRIPVLKHPHNSKGEPPVTGIETKPLKKSVPKRVPNYQRTTSSVTNRETKTNSDTTGRLKPKLRAVTGELSSTANVNQRLTSTAIISHLSNKTGSKRNTVQKDWQSGLRSDIPLDSRNKSELRSIVTSEQRNQKHVTKSALIKSRPVRNATRHSRTTSPASVPSSCSSDCSKDSNSTAVSVIRRDKLTLKSSNRDSSSRSRSSTPSVASTTSATSNASTDNRNNKKMKIKPPLEISKSTLSCSTLEKHTRETSVKTDQICDGVSQPQTGLSTDKVSTTIDDVSRVKRAKRVSVSGDITSRPPTSTRNYSSSLPKTRATKTTTNVSKTMHADNTINRGSLSVTSGTSSDNKKCKKTLTSIPKQVPSMKQTNPRQDQNLTRESYSRSRSTTPSTSSMSSDSTHSNKSASKYPTTLSLKRQISRDSKSRSRSTTSSTSSISSDSTHSNKSSSKSQTALSLKRQISRSSKSRSRSPTPGEIYVSSCCNHSDQSITISTLASSSKLKMIQEHRNIAGYSSSQTRSVSATHSHGDNSSHKFRIPVRNPRRNQTNGSISRPESTTPYDSNVSTKKNSNKNSAPNTSKPYPLLKHKPQQNVPHNARTSTLLTRGLSVAKETTHEAKQTAAASILQSVSAGQACVKSNIMRTKLSNKCLPASSSVTMTTSQQQSMSSCGPLTSVEQLSGSSQRINVLLENEDSCNNKPQQMSTAATDKPVQKLTTLSLTPDSRIKADKSCTSERNKNLDNIQIASKNRSCKLSGKKISEKKVNKAFVSGIKSMATPSLHVIKKDRVSTSFCNKSGSGDTEFQNQQYSQVAETAVVNSELQNKRNMQFMEESVVNLEFESGSVCEVDDLIDNPLDVRLITVINDRASTGILTNKNMCTNETSDNMDILQREISDGDNGQFQVAISGKVDNQDRENNYFVNCPTSEVIMKNSHHAKYPSDENNGVKICEECTMGIREIASTLNDWTDRNVATDTDLIPKVSCNCLSAMSENEQARVHDIGPCTELASMKNENTNNYCKCELNECSHRALHIGMDITSTQPGSGRDTFREDIVSLESTEVHYIQGECPSSQLQQSENLIIDLRSSYPKTCDDCPSYGHKRIETKSGGIDAHAENRCTKCDNSVTMDNASLSSAGDYMSSESDNKIKRIHMQGNAASTPLKISQNFRCQNDKHTEASIFYLDSCDVNSSHRMPINEGYALKHRKCSDSQIDTIKCIDATPVRGAVMLQSINKRQDKKIESVSSCDVHIEPLCCGIEQLHISSCGKKNITDVCDTITNDGYNNNVTEIVRSLCTENASSSSGDFSMCYFAANNLSDDITDSNVSEAPSFIEQHLSDWQNEALGGMTSSKNKSENQVLHNCEINKEISDTGNSCRKLTGTDFILCDEMDLFKQEHISDEDLDKTDIKCDTNLNTKKIKDTVFEDSTHSVKQEHINEAGMDSIVECNELCDTGLKTQNMTDNVDDGDSVIHEQFIELYEDDTLLDNSLNTDTVTVHGVRGVHDVKQEIITGANVDNIYRDDTVCCNRLDNPNLAKDVQPTVQPVVQDHITEANINSTYTEDTLCDNGLYTEHLTDGAHTNTSLHGVIQEQIIRENMDSICQDVTYCDTSLHTSLNTECLTNDVHRDGVLHDVNMDMMIETDTDNVCICEGIAMTTLCDNCLNTPNFMEGVHTVVHDVIQDITEANMDITCDENILSDSSCNTEQLTDGVRVDNVLDIIQQGIINTDMDNTHTLCDNNVDTQNMAYGVHKDSVNDVANVKNTEAGIDKTIYEDDILCDTSLYAENMTEDIPGVVLDVKQEDTNEKETYTLCDDDILCDNSITTQTFTECVHGGMGYDRECVLENKGEFAQRSGDMDYNARDNSVCMLTHSHDIIDLSEAQQIPHRHGNSQMGGYINYHGDENSLPERDLRTNDGKVINTEPYKSFHAPGKHECISHISSGLCHTGLEMINYSDSCENNRYSPLSNDENIEMVSNFAETDINGSDHSQQFLQDQLLRFKADGNMPEIQNWDISRVTPPHIQENQISLDCEYDSNSLFSQGAITEDGLIITQCDTVNESQILDTETSKQRDRNNTPDTENQILGTETSKQKNSDNSPNTEAEILGTETSKQRNIDNSPYTEDQILDTETSKQRNIDNSPNTEDQILNTETSKQSNVDISQDTEAQILGTATSKQLNRDNSQNTELICSYTTEDASQNSDVCILDIPKPKLSTTDEYTSCRLEFAIPKLSECVYQTYPNLKPVCNIDTANKLNHEKQQCSQLRKHASLNNSSFSLQFNDNCCLLQKCKHSDRDGITVPHECLYCTDLSHTHEAISNGNSNMLQSQEAGNGSLQNAENNLCTDSMPRDVNKIEISALINRSKSSEYHEINDLSLLCDEKGDIHSNGTIPRDHARATAAPAELSCENVADLTDLETLKTSNRTVYQDGFEDKPSDLSAFKVSTQQSSRTLMFSGESTEPKDFMSRYEQKYSTGHKKLYSCNDELDIGFIGSQEGNNFTILAGNRDEEINSEIKLQNEKLETPTHCEESHFRKGDLKKEISLTDCQGQCTRVLQECSSNENIKYIKNDGNICENIQVKQNWSSGLPIQPDYSEIRTKLSDAEHVLSTDNCCSSIYPELGSDNRDVRNENDEFIQENSFKTDICQSEWNINDNLPISNEELNSSSNVLNKVINSVSGEQDIQTDITDEFSICVTSDTGDLELHRETYGCGVPCEISAHENKELTEIAPLRSHDNDTVLGLKLPDTISCLNICKSQTRDQIPCNTDKRYSTSDETLSDTSEAFIDADDRLHSPYLDKTIAVEYSNSYCTNHNFSTFPLNTSCGESTSTESFVDAVENLDDDYLTSTKIRHSNELQNEETVSQISSTSDDSSTSIVESMDELSGWDEFSEDLEDICVYNDAMETNNTRMTSIDGTPNCIPDAKALKSVRRTRHVFHDNNYQRAPPSLESKELYPSKIKTNTSRYINISDEADQTIRNSIFKTGNGGTLKEICEIGIKTQARVGIDTESTDADYGGHTNSSIQVLHTDAILHDDVIKSTISSNTRITRNEQSTAKENVLTGCSGEQYVNDISDSTPSQLSSTIGSKIETAVIKRTERRRRRIIEQLHVKTSNKTVNYKTENYKDACEVSDIHLNLQDNIRDNASSESSTCSHSEHPTYSCTISDNMAFSDEPASGTKVISQHVNTNLNVSEFNLDSIIKKADTPLNYDCGDNITKDVNLRIDDVDTFELTPKGSQNEYRCTSGGIQLNEIHIGVNDTIHNDILKTECNASENTDTIGTCNHIYSDVSVHLQDTKDNETEAEDTIQSAIDVAEHASGKDVDLDDIAFIDADDNSIVVIQNEVVQYKEVCSIAEDENKSKQEQTPSPTISFTFSFGDEYTELPTHIYDKGNNDICISNSSSQKPYIACVDVNGCTQETNHLDLFDKDVGLELIANDEIKVVYPIDITDLKHDSCTGERLTSGDVCKSNEEYSFDSSLDKSSDNVQEVSLTVQHITAEDNMQTEISEESNISVKHALALERQKLASDVKIRSRKGLFISKRSDRRATIEIYSIEDKEIKDIPSEGKDNVDAIQNYPVTKTTCAQHEQNQTTPLAVCVSSAVNEADTDINEAMETNNKKVSDICRTFMTKTKVSAQKSRAKSASKSPAPHRKLMQWVNNNGKWMRIPVDELLSTQNNNNDLSKVQDKSKCVTVESTHKNDSEDEILKPDELLAHKESEVLDERIVDDQENSITLKLESNADMINNETSTDTRTVNESFNSSKIKDDKESETSDIVTIETHNELLKMQSVSSSNRHVHKTNTIPETGIICSHETISSCDSAQINLNETFSDETILQIIEHDTNMGNTKDNTNVQDNIKHLQEEHGQLEINHDCDINDGRKVIVDSGKELLHEHTINEFETDIEMKIIGTALDDAQCDNERHLKRQELLFGLLDSYNRRHPRRLTQSEDVRKSKPAYDHISNVNKNDLSRDKETKNDSIVDMPDNVEVTRSIPKLKAVKIQEEVFECKEEYLKDNNINPASSFDNKVSHLSKSNSITSYKDNLAEHGTDSKLRKLRKSQTFSGLGEMERQQNTQNSTLDYRCQHQQRDTIVHSQSTTKLSPIKTVQVVEVSDNTDTENVVIDKHNVNGKFAKSKMFDKRTGLRLKIVNMIKSQSLPRNLAQADRSPNRLCVDNVKHRSHDDISTSRPSADQPKVRLSVDQPKVRLRSPDKGPRQSQRAMLLSEIVEVEESKDDNSVSCDRQRHYRDRQRPEVQNPVRRSNKRRSLSLPTGTLAFGDARIVYKNGHFTIETMDTTEVDTGSQDGSHVDDMWDMPDTSRESSRVKSNSREVTDMHNKPLMRRQYAKTVLQKYDSTEDVFYNEIEFAEDDEEDVDPYKPDLNGESRMSGMGRMDEEVLNESNSSRTSDMSVDSNMSDRTDISTDESVTMVTDKQKLSSSSLPVPKDDEMRRVIQRAKRTSSFRAAQERGALRLSGIEEDKVHDTARARSVSLDDGQNTDSNKSPKIQSVQNQNPTFLKKVMAKRKTLNDNLNISAFTKQSESAKEFFSKKMTLKGLFRKNKSDSSVGSPLRMDHPVSPPIATFKDYDIVSVDTPPSSPYRKRELRRRHTSADIFQTFPDTADTDSNCPTPTQERSIIAKRSISSPSTPSREAISFLNLGSNSAPPFRDDDEMSITSTSSIASSIHSPPLEQPHKPKTPKPAGASPRRNPSTCSQLSRTGSQSSQRSVMNSVTSLESDQYEQDDVARDPRCECNYKFAYHKQRTSNCNIEASADSLIMCQYCKQTELCYKSDSALSNSSFNKQSSKEKLTDDSARCRKDSSGRSNYERLGIISQADVASSNSNDSGIQRDASLHSSTESIKGTPDSRVRLRRNKSLSPHPDRPKSEISVRWADADSGDYDITETPVKLRHRNSRDRPRPKSDLDGSSFLSDRMKAFGSEIDLQPYCSLRNLYEMRRRDLDKQKNRRMSTPHPIKSRLQRVPHKLQKQPPLVRSSSMPESLDKIHKRRKMHHLLDFHLDSLSRHMDIDDCLSDESDLSFDQASLQDRSVSMRSSTSQLTAMDEDEDNLTYAEALWDHITMDPEELGFRAQDVIEVLDMADKDWWFGVIEDREGWFPATFVRIRVNQDRLDDDLDLDVTIQDQLTTSPKLRRISMFNKNQARTNVVNEIISAEKEYVKHLKDVVEGYIQHARKRTEMFPEERISLIFGNLETIYSFALKFVSQLEMCIDECPHLSEIGQCFLDNERGFEIYSDYCNNHPSACEELDELCKDSKYKHFFEACRLLQELVEIPLEGFLLTPVQKICKYPLQLAELLKYTPPDHPDYIKVKNALSAMRKIATLINERKRKMESIEKIAVWQHSVVDWEGPDLLVRSSELIFSGDLSKINTAGWSQDRFFFLFDHQLVYCKKELLKRHVFSYKGRIDIDNCDIVDVPDGKDLQYNVTVKYAWKFHETRQDKWYLVYAKTEAVKQHWLKALKDERQRVVDDQANNFCVPYHWKQTVLNKVMCQSHPKDKQFGGRGSQGQLMLHKDYKDFPYSTLPRHRTSQKHDHKKKGWFKFGGGKKSKS